MKTEELRQMSSEQLALTLKEMEKNLFHLRVQSATERLETPSEIRKCKRDIARIKTIQRQAELPPSKSELNQLSGGDLVSKLDELEKQLSEVRSLKSESAAAVTEIRSRRRQVIRLEESIAHIKTIQRKQGLTPSMSS